MSRQRCPIQLHELDAVALDGRYQIVSNGDRFALARWSGTAFVYSSGVPVEFTATHYYNPGKGGDE